MADAPAYEPPKGYTFGIELEYRLKPNWPGSDNVRGNPTKIRDKLAGFWNTVPNRDEGYIPMESHYTSDILKYNIWNIVDEYSVDKDDGTVPMKLVSPIFQYSDRDSWKNQVLKAMGLIVNKTDPSMDDGTGFHIRVAPVNRQWSLLDLQRIAAAIDHFHEPLKQLFPNSPVKSNTTDHSVVRKLPKSASLGTHVYTAKTIDNVIKIVNPGRQRNYAWNFTNLSDGDSSEKSTLEFRSPRSTTESRFIEKWITFTATFVQASVTDPEYLHFEFEQDIDGLNGFLVHNGGTVDFCWEEFLSQQELDNVRNGKGYNNHGVNEAA